MRAVIANRVPFQRECASDNLRCCKLDTKGRVHLRLYQLFWKVRQSCKASSLVASCGMVALVGILSSGPAQMQHTWPTLSLHTPATTAMDCSMCVTSMVVAHHPTPVLSAERTHLAAQVPVYHASAYYNRTKKPAATRVTTVTPLVRGRPIKLSPPAKHKRRPPRKAGKNVFPYGACTWWADQRYYQLHGIFVPWHTQANA